MACDMVRIQTEDFSVEEEVAKVRASFTNVGAVVTFLGTTRDFSEGKDVQSIEFEQYASMALRAMEDLRTDTLSKFDVLEVRIVHRVDNIKPGGQIVLIAIASKHRKEAFDACEWCIDTLKQTVPLWKKEITPDGDSWVVPHP